MHDFQPCVSLDTPTHSSDAAEAATRSEEASVNAQSTAVYDVRMSLPAALRDALGDTVSWEVFYSHLYKRKTLEEIAPQFDVSPSFLSKRVTSKILQKLRAYFGAQDWSRTRNEAKSAIFASRFALFYRRPIFCSSSRGHLATRRSEV